MSHLLKNTKECCASLCLASPSGVVQVQKESFLTKFGKHFIVMSVHVTCESRKVQKEDSSSKTGGVLFIRWLNVIIYL